LYNEEYFDMRDNDRQRRLMAYANDAYQVLHRKPDARHILDVGAGMGEFS
jgi:hypothetical protein